MTDDVSVPMTPRAPRRWFAFSLRTLLLLVTVLAIWLGYMVHTARVQLEAVAALRKLDVAVSYDFECKLEANGEIVPNINPPPDPRGLAWLTDLVGVDFFNTVVVVVEIGSYDSPSEQREARLLLPAICRLTGIRRMGIIGTRLHDQDLAQLRVLKQLDSLDVSHNPITDAGLRYFADFPKLRYLSVKKTEITDKGIRSLSALTNLEGLSLAATQVTDVGLKFLLTLQQLEHLELRGTQITDEGLKVLTTLTKLIDVDIQQTRVTSEGIHRLQMALPNLKIISDYDRVRQLIDLQQ